VRRAGLDYWGEVPLQLWDSFEALQRAQSAGARYFFLTTKTQHPYYSVDFREDDFLVFGRETKGLPNNLLAANTDNCITIPMHGTRSLNLATAVAIVLFEAVRQQQA
jgi:tRNA (cytidine/uridine-2'-O-)-methyltransferase